MLRQRKPREQSRDHRTFVGSLPCVVCMADGLEVYGSDCAHVTFLGVRGMSSKVDDRFTVPLCRDHHNHQHANPPEATWWARSGIPVKWLCGQLWAVTGDYQAGEKAVREAASETRRLSPVRTAAELRDPVDAAPPLVTIQAHRSAEPADADGNVAVLIPQLGKRGCPPALVHVDPNAVSPSRPSVGAGEPS